MSKDRPRRRHWILGLLALAAFVFVFRADLWRLYYRVEYLPIILQASRDQSTDPHLLAAIIFVESRFRPEAVSDVGARGLMQLMPETAFEVAERYGLGEVKAEQLHSPELNIALGSRYFAELQRRFPRLERALAAYNAGPTLVEQWKNGVIEFPETRHFVDEVMTHRARLEKLYPGWDTGQTGTPQRSR